MIPHRKTPSARRFSSKQLRSFPLLSCLAPVRPAGTGIYFRHLAGGFRVVAAPAASGQFSIPPTVLEGVVAGNSSETDPKRKRSLSSVQQTKGRPVNGRHQLPTRPGLARKQREQYRAISSRVTQAAQTGNCVTFMMRAPDQHQTTQQLSAFNRLRKRHERGEN